METFEQCMKISSAKVRRLRSERGWSQEQLALASGLSLRTIQRVEAEGNAARETQVCIAATFAITLAELGEEFVDDKPLPLVALPPRYKVGGALASLMLIPVLFSFSGVIPARFDLYISLSFMAMIALFSTQVLVGTLTVRLKTRRGQSVLCKCYLSRRLFFVALHPFHTLTQLSSDLLHRLRFWLLLFISCLISSSLNGVRLNKFLQ